MEYHILGKMQKKWWHLDVRDRKRTFETSIVKKKFSNQVENQINVATLAPRKKKKKKKAKQAKTKQNTSVQWHLKGENDLQIYTSIIIIHE